MAAYALAPLAGSVTHAAPPRPALSLAAVAAKVPRVRVVGLPAVAPTRGLRGLGAPTLRADGVDGPHVTGGAGPLLRPPPAHVGTGEVLVQDEMAAAGPSEGA